MDYVLFKCSSFMFHSNNFFRKVSKKSKCNISKLNVWNAILVQKLSYNGRRNLMFDCIFKRVARDSSTPLRFSGIFNGLKLRGWMAEGRERCRFIAGDYTRLGSLRPQRRVALKRFWKREHPFIGNC